MRSLLCSIYLFSSPLFFAIVACSGQQIPADKVSIELIRRVRLEENDTTSISDVSYAEIRAGQLLISDNRGQSVTLFSAVSGSVVSVINPPDSLWYMIKRDVTRITARSFVTPWSDQEYEESRSVNSGLNADLLSILRPVIVTARFINDSLVYFTGSVRFQVHSGLDTGTLNLHGVNFVGTANIRSRRFLDIHALDFPPNGSDLLCMRNGVIRTKDSYLINTTYHPALDGKLDGRVLPIAATYTSNGTWVGKLLFLDPITSATAGYIRQSNQFVRLRANEIGFTCGSSPFVLVFNELGDWKRTISYQTIVERVNPRLLPQIKFGVPGIGSQNNTASSSLHTMAFVPIGGQRLASVMHDWDRGKPRGPYYTNLVIGLDDGNNRISPLAIVPEVSDGFRPLLVVDNYNADYNSIYIIEQDTQGGDYYLTEIRIKDD